MAGGQPARPSRWAASGLAAAAGLAVAACAAGAPNLGPARRRPGTGGQPDGERRGPHHQGGWARSRR